MRMVFSKKEFETMKSKGYDKKQIEQVRNNAWLEANKVSNIHTSLNENKIK